ncbi:MAG: hypothetical protein K8W52_45760 [Deltaproteobacteria bacterium]|nr:hypothetical protein [Deltaproteobacteria bacterium]
MSTLWKLPGAFAELAVGSVVVLYHLTLVRRLDQAALTAGRKRTDEPARRE